MGVHGNSGLKLANSPAIHGMKNWGIVGRSATRSGSKNRGPLPPPISLLSAGPLRRRRVSACLYRAMCGRGRYEGRSPSCWWIFVIEVRGEISDASDEPGFFIEGVAFKYQIITIWGVPHLFIIHSLLIRG